jgi:hypothetical protein
MLIDSQSNCLFAPPYQTAYGCVQNLLDITYTTVVTQPQPTPLLPRAVSTCMELPSTIYLLTRIHAMSSSILHMYRIKVRSLAVFLTFPVRTIYFHIIWSELEYKQRLGSSLQTCEAYKYSHSMSSRSMNINSDFHCCNKFFQYKHQHY